MLQEITNENFEKLILENPKPIILDFGAPSCGPCKMIKPFIEQLALEYEEEVMVGNVNINTNVELALKFGIRNVPTVLYLKDGKVVNKQVGSTSKTILEQKLKKDLLNI